MRRRPRRKFSSILKWGVILVVVVVLVFLGREFLREHATVTVVEKTRAVAVEGPFIGKRDAKDGELAFETLSSSKEDSVTVPSTGEKKVETRASGTIVIYNNYSTASQRLIKNTRFETPDGRIYRVDQSVVVPGKNKADTPGSIEAVVYADAAGKDYNIGLSDFTIPGFKGDPRYSKFYARSKTPMSGGFIGMIKTASPEDLKKAKDSLEAGLREALMKDVVAQKPDDYTLFPNAFYVEYESMSPPDSNEVHEKATAYGVIFKSAALAQGIAAKTVADYETGEIVKATNLSSIMFTPIPAETKPWQTGVVSFSLVGTTTLIWIFDEEKLRNDLSGQMKDKTRIAEILKAYPSIDTAEVVVRPFWKATLPKDPQAISVKISDVAPK